MGNTEKYIDLHIHSTFSDGHFNVDELVEMARQSNTNFIAISDHDTVKSFSVLKNNLLDGMYTTSAVEFSTYLMMGGSKIKLHLLGYGFNSENNKIQSLLTELKRRRLKIHYKFLTDLENQFKHLPDEVYKLDIERYCWFDRDVLQCIRDNLCDMKKLQDYETYFKNHKLRYGLSYPINIEDAINVINNAGGISVLAHPMAYGLSFEQMQVIIQKLILMGVQGIETFQSDCSYEDSIKLLNEANEYNLLYSVGSDFHRLVNSDGRKIGKGINNNLCITTTSVTEELFHKKLVLKGKK